MALSIPEIVASIIKAGRSTPCDGCVIKVLHRDIRYDPDDRYYAGTGASADSYKPLQEFYGEGTITLDANALRGGTEKLIALVAAELKAYGDTLTSDYEEPVLDGFSVFQNAYEDRELEQKSEVLIQELALVDAELIEYLAMHPDELQYLHWRRFEELLSSIFRNQGFDVELGPGRGDEGIDLRLIYKDAVGTMLTLVQAKRYRRDRKITLEAVAALAGVVVVNNAHRGLFVTTSDFLPGARRFAEEKAGRIILANESDVTKWLRNSARGK